MNRRFSHIMAVLTVTALVLTGCNGRNKEKDNSDIEEKKDPIIVVNNIASEAGKILTDEAGYEKKGSKKAIVQDVLNAADFDVIDVNTDETVLSGRIKYKKDASGKKAASGICDLTSLDKTGKFYIRINTGKVSNVFTVEDDIYKRLLSDRLSNLGERDSVSQSYLEEDISACYMRITDYLLAQEFFPDAISPAAEKETKIIPRTMLLAKSEMDLLKNYMRKDGSFEALLADDLGRQYQYSAVFALFAYEYKEFDKKSSQECAKIAETAYDMAEEIRKYLKQPKIIVLTALKLEQLEQAIELHYSNHYDKMIGKGLPSSEISDMALKYVIKLIPENNRIYMPESRVWSDSLVNVYIEDVYGDKEHKEKKWMH